MNPLLRKQIRNAVGLKVDTEFQDFVAFLFGLACGQQFTAVKQKRDKGCDGILDGDTILAVYAPESHTLARFKKKLGDDYKSYTANWKKTHPGWMVVFNNELTAGMIQFIDGKHPGVRKMGLPEIVKMIEALPWSKIHRVGEYLGIPSELLLNDLIGQVVDDLIRNGEAGKSASQRPQAVYIEDKIAINFAPEEVQQATDRYYECLEYFEATEGIFREHSGMEVAALRSRICNDFNSLGGAFSQRFQGLLNQYCHAHPSDDLYHFAVIVLLTFFFEQCLIGAKAESERTC